MVAACLGERCLESATESSSAALEHIAPHSLDSTMMLSPLRSTFLPSKLLEPFVLTQLSTTFSV